MLYFIYGTDDIKARTKAKELIAVMHGKRPDAEIFSITDENWSEGILDQFIGGQGLFERKCIILLDGLGEAKDTKVVLLDKITELKKSENAFVLLEKGLDKKTIEKIEKNAEKTQVFEKPEVKKEYFNMFSLAEALGRNDKKSLWVLYQKALAEEVAPEEIHGILWWQIKTMLIVSKTDSAESADLKPFVYGKAKGYLKNFSKEKLSLLGDSLVAVYHDSRRGIGEFETNLEKLILEI